MTVHASWVYDSLHNKIPRITRYDVRSAQMEFSLTDTQLPMFLRIVKLILALYYGDLHESDENTGDAKKDSNKPHDFSVDMSLAEEELDEENRHNQQGWGL